MQIIELNNASKLCVTLALNDLIDFQFKSNTCATTLLIFCDDHSIMGLRQTLDLK